MSVLLSMKHARMELNFIGDASFLDVEFLKKHAIAENLSNLEIKSDRVRTCYFWYLIEWEKNRLK